MLNLVKQINGNARCKLIIVFVTISVLDQLMAG